MTEIPDYIEQRIRRPVPAGSCVVPGSTPVVAFGNASTATVATLGLNPSKHEFLDGNKLLVGGKRRLATHQSLGTSDLVNAPSSKVAQVLQDCDSYFQRNHNPYWQWFRSLENLLNDWGLSYCDGSACHLDLVQWATNPAWGNLPSGLQDRLIHDDGGFLMEQIANGNFTRLLLNGKTVVDQMQRITGESLVELDPIKIPGRPQTNLFAGKMFARVQVIGWNRTMRYISNEVKSEISRRVSVLRLH